MDTLRKKKLRLFWIIPNLFCYVMLIGCLIFVVTNVQGLVTIQELGFLVLMLMILLSVSLFGTYRIWTWIKEGKI